MKLISLTQDQHALVDDSDFDWLSRLNWYAVFKNHRKPEQGWYAERSYTDSAGKRRKLRMHREILNLGFGDEPQVDHKSGDGLDNRRDNLRIATRQQNNFNFRVIGGSSKFKGVSLEKRTIKPTWKAYIVMNRRQTSLGTFKTECAAAAAYDRAANKLFGEFAATNKALGLF